MLYLLEKNFFAKKVFTFLFIAEFFVSPLIFFTDLTRNPYYFQITLLNISILSSLICFAVYFFLKGRIFFTRNILNRPLAIMLVFLLLTSFYAFYNHNEFFRSAILSEAFKNHIFLIVNCLLTFYISQNIPFSRRKTNIGKWAYFLFLWPLLWLFYSSARVTAGHSVFSHFWDPYGAFVWVVAVVWLLKIMKDFSQEDFLNLIFVAATIASAYGVLQYFRVELIWSKLLNPYGNRSVSTFGNPNFISSYLVMLLPLVAWQLIKSFRLIERVFYGFIFITFESMLLASLTRSSWLGFVAAILFLLAFKEVRLKISANKKFLAAFAFFAVFLLVAWPNDSLKPMSSAIVERVGEGGQKVTSVKKITLNVRKEHVYPSLHQRLLIWSSGWQMGLENPVCGKGWGLFELFYPFYQGPLLERFAGIRNLRTHANNAHNEIIEIFSQSGILGLGLFMWIFAVLFSAFFRFRKYAGESDMIIFPMFSAVVGMFADNMLNVSLHFAVPAFLFWWLVGALSLRLSSPAAFGELKEMKIGSRPAKIVAIFLILVSLLGIYYWHLQFMREVYYFKGFKAMRKSKFAEAKTYLEKAHAYHSREVNANYELANAYVRLENYQKAEWAYKEALSSNCGYDEIFFNLSIVEKKLEKYKKAIESLKMSILINPINKLNYSAISEMYMRKGKKYAGEAIEVLERARKLFPRDISILNALGYFHSTQGDYQKARYFYARAVRINPDDNMIAANLELSLRQLGIQNDQDLAWLRKYRRIAKKVEKGEITIGLLKECQEILKQNYSLAVVYLKSRIYFLLSDIDSAEKELRKILKEEPENANALYALGVILEKKGDCANARDKFKRLLSISPGNRKVKKHLNNLNCPECSVQ